MRTLLQDLAQKSLKGLGTKACTNWEDRSANSLAYQVSNHSIFFYMLYGSVCRALIWWEPLCMTSKDTVMPQNLKADVSVLCQNVQGKVCFILMKTSINRPWHLISIYVWGGGEHRKCHIVMYEHSLLWVEFFFFLSFLCFCYSVINFLHHTFFKHLWEGESICSYLIFPKWNTIQRRNNTWLCV